MDKTRTYRVVYAVTRTEYYEIAARNRRDAEDRAFSDGRLLEDGETTNVEFCWLEVAPADRKKKGRAS